MKTAVLVLSRAGLDLARRIRSAWPGETAIFGPACVVGSCAGPPTDDARPGSPILPGAFATGEPGLCGWLGPLRQFLPSVWAEFDAIIAIMALGIVVRLVGPLALDKRRDPATLVIDEAGQFVVSVLGGHAAGANALAERLAELLGATAVVTTASDAHRLPAVDQIGRALGWKMEPSPNLTRVAAAVVRRDPVAVWQDTGSTNWWQPFGPWPQHFTRLSSWADWDPDRFSALLYISDRALPDPLAGGPPVLVYRPPSLVAGIGCRRGTPQETIEALVQQVFADHALALESLAEAATVTLKAAEPGLVAFAQKRGVPLRCFTPAELAAQPGVENPSEQVRARIGIVAVAEPAALRAAGAARLLVPKQKGPGVTLALARVAGMPGV